MVNKVTLIGNLGKDPEIVKLPSGQTISNLTIATTQKKYIQTLNKYEYYTEWHKIVVFKQNASFAKTLKKGYLIYVEGRLQTRNWIDKDGNKRNTTEICGNILKNLTHKTTRNYISEKDTEDENVECPRRKKY